MMDGIMQLSCCSHLTVRQVTAALSAILEGLKNSFQTKSAMV